MPKFFVDDLTRLMQSSTRAAVPCEIESLSHCFHSVKNGSSTAICLFCELHKILCLFLLPKQRVRRYKQHSFYFFVDSSLLDRTRPKMGEPDRAGPRFADSDPAERGS